MGRDGITFHVGGQVFGLDTGLVRDMRAWSPVTRVAGLPPCVAGVTHRRGTLLPVIERAPRLGWPPPSAPTATPS
jgi:purine-binding chemotaxis protein CheW